MKTKTKNKEQSYDEWRINKINEIREAFACSEYEATIMFLLQDIAYKLSSHYAEKTGTKES